MTQLTIVVYHYVRPLARTRYPTITGLDLSHFDEQLDYMQRFYNPVSMEDVVGALDSGHELPRRSLLITFDDGYIDHYTYVFPRLAARGLRGAFFPPSQVVLQRRLLDVNRIHYILASVVTPAELVIMIERDIAAHAKSWQLDELSAYREKFYYPSRYDSADVAYVKRLLQHALPETLRTQVVAELFERFVSVDEKSFAEELYISLEQLRLMASSNQHVGSHGDSHYCLSLLSADRQRADIEASVQMLDLVGVPSDMRTLCFPYGDYNNETISILQSLDFKAAVTTRADLANLQTDSRFELPRLDTNDLPKSGHADMNRWTLAAEME